MVLKRRRSATFTESLKEKEWIPPCLCYLGLVCIHIVMACFMSGPRIFGDEMGYLGNARYLAGKGVLPNMAGAPFYHAGYSILISPSFLLSGDPGRVYFFILVLNSFLISSLFLFLCYWLRDVAGFDRKISLMAATAVSLYPPFLLHSNTAWAENAVIPLFIVPSLLLYLTLKSKSVFLGIVFGLSVSFLYTVHPRALPLLPMTVLYLAIVGLLRMLPPRVVLASLSSFSLGLWATLHLHQDLRFLGWAGGGIPSASRILSRLTVGTGLYPFVLGVSGQLWYLTASTYGLFLIGFLLLGLTLCKNFSSLKNEAGASARTHALLFYGLSAAGVFILSVLFLSGPRWIAERPVYGRYNECFVAALVALALGTLVAGGFQGVWRKWATAPLIGLAGLGLITSLSKVAPIEVSSLIPENVHGLFPVLGTLVYKLNFSFGPAVLICTVVFLLGTLFLARAFHFHRMLGVLSLSGLFIIMAVSQYAVLYHPGVRDSLSLPGAIRALPGVNAVSFDLDFGTLAQRYRYQYLLPYTRFSFFNSSKGEFPETDVFITSRFSERFRNSGACLLTAEEEGNLGLWVKAGKNHPPQGDNLVKGNDPAKK